VKKIYGNDLHSGLTMTVKELRDELSKYPDDMPVVATWEGVRAGITPQDFLVSEPTPYGVTEKQLEIDVEDYG